MMTTENLPTRPQPVSSEQTPNADSNNRKPLSSSSQKSQTPSKAASPKCPRCDSTQTKFCYYNNYSLTQPRYFCKSCRRYWTKGGALRNVPVGGGCRKNKKMKSSSSSSSTSTLLPTFHFPMDFGDMTSDIGGLKFLHGSTRTSTSPAVDFQLGGGLTNFSRIQSTPIAPLAPAALCPQISSFADISANRSYGLDLTAGLEGRNTCPTSFLGLSNSSISSTGLKPTGYGISSVSDLGTTNLMTSIESLSSINQELHWKLQQQRLAMLYGQGQGEEDNKEDQGSLRDNNHHQMEKLQPTFFQNLETPKGNDDRYRRHQAMGGVIGGSTAARKEENTSRGAVTEWFFDNVPHTSSSVMGGVITNGANTPSSNNGGGKNNNDVSGMTNFIQGWDYGNHHH